MIEITNMELAKKISDEISNVEKLNKAEIDYLYKRLLESFNTFRINFIEKESNINKFIQKAIAGKWFVSEIKYKRLNKSMILKQEGAI